MSRKSNPYYVVPLENTEPENYFPKTTLYHTDPALNPIMSLSDFKLFFAAWGLSALQEFYEPLATRDEDWEVLVTGVGQLSDGQWAALFAGLIYDADSDKDVEEFMLVIDQQKAVHVATWAMQETAKERQQILEGSENGASLLELIDERQRA